MCPESSASEEIRRTFCRRVPLCQIQLLELCLKMKRPGALQKRRQHTELKLPVLQLLENRVSFFLAERSRQIYRRRAKQGSNTISGLRMKAAAQQRSALQVLSTLRRAVLQKGIRQICG